MDLDLVAAWLKRHRVIYTHNQGVYVPKPKPDTHHSPKIAQSLTFRTLETAPFQSCN